MRDQKALADAPVPSLTRAAVVLESVSKRYRIYSSPQDRLRNILGLPMPPGRVMEFSALDGINLTFDRGQFCGIIGRNGAGKSTLLRIVAGQLTPTTGSRRTFGRISLLQLGKGFDPELTGRENVCNSLRLTLMDVTISEQIVADIIDFSELGEFINFPLKTYSSGMYSRLAFATAVSVDPDILIADEVLAVGDINFSQKCMRRMLEFKERGKTVILVTHDLNSVRVFCDRAVLIEGGRVVTDGDPQDVCERFRNYMLYGVSLNDKAQGGAGNDSEGPPAVESAGGSDVWDVPRAETFVSIFGKGEIQGYRLRHQGSYERVSAIAGGASVCFDILFSLDSQFTFSSVAFTMHDDRGQIVLHLNSGFDGLTTTGGSQRGLRAISFAFQMPYFKAGQYSFSYGVCIDRNGAGEVAFKHDFDFAIEIAYPRSEKWDQQGGLVLIPEFTVRELALNSAG